MIFKKNSVTAWLSSKNTLHNRGFLSVRCRFLSWFTMFFLKSHCEYESPYCRFYVKPGAKTVLFKRVLRFMKPTFQYCKDSYSTVAMKFSHLFGQLHALGSKSFLEQQKQGIENLHFRVVVCGEFKRGKSTLINALIFIWN